jgi:hypothetical protein
MNSWRVDADLEDCPALAALVVLLHVAVAAAPWFAGCEAWLGLLLSSGCAAALPGALRAVPGPRCPIRRLGHADGVLTVTLACGERCPATVVAASRVLADIAFCRLEVTGQMLDLWIPRYAMTAADYRRLKVGIRCRDAAEAR